MTGSLTQAEILLRKRGEKSARSGSTQNNDELAMAKAFVRAAHELLGMRVRVLSASARTETGIEQLTPVFEDHALCLAGTGRDGATGVIALSLELVTAIVEKSATGEVGDRPVPDRSGTSIDALFAEPVLKAMLKNFAPACAPEIRSWIDGVTLAGKPSKSDDLEFKISEGAHRVVMLRLQLDGIREGEIVALIPQTGAPGATKGGRVAGGSQYDKRAEGFRLRLLSSRTTLRADLITLDVPLADFRNWAVGSAVKIPGDAIGAVGLTQGGDVQIAKGRLGQADGHRAVRLDLPLPPVARAPDPDAPQDNALLPSAVEAVAVSNEDVVPENASPEPESQLPTPTVA